MSYTISIAGNAGGAFLIAAMATTGMITTHTGTASAIMTATPVIAPNDVAGIKGTNSV